MQSSSYSFETGIKVPKAICPYCNKTQKVEKKQGLGIFQTHYANLSRTKLCEGSGQPVPER